MYTVDWRGLPKIHPLIVAELAVGHISMVPDDLTNMLWGHVLFLSLHEAKLSLFTVPFTL